MLLLLFLQAACVTGSSRGLTSRRDHSPVQVSDLEFRHAFTRLLLDVPLRITDASPRPGVVRLRRAIWPSNAVGDASVEAGYARWCARRGSPGDCFLLLGEGPYDATLGQRDRFILALGLAFTPSVEAAMGVLRDFSREAMTVMVTGLSLYLVVLLAPEPLSKGLATAMTLFLWGYLGHELWGLISATTQLWDDVQSARTFHQLRGASEQYAQVLGPNTLRLLILLATWQAGVHGKDFTTGHGLPGFSQAVRNAASLGRIDLTAVAAEATSVSLAEGRLVLTYPSGAAVVLSMRTGEDEAGEVHHIATVENEKSALRGGPWTPRFKRFFDKAGMSMEDPANKVRVPGHKGPHPQAYHERIHRRLSGAMEDCETTVQCQEVLSRELKALAEQLRRAGSEFNKLITGNP
ncbi:AHH domain-containing protein [Archangium primigenium]|uniref:AHH domain-containing protein n=1 Tax=[Archangium] primigenium TaxID=2792470 RepID=UPI001EF8E00D|nr:AHH domain-containing protein [Archangium primigenium]